MVKISVIIPVYNAEKYLSMCLDSILQQSFQDFEIIAVNDGSTDNSGRILTKYAKKDKRIQVISQVNAGVSAARNAGMRVAQGEYISFVDGDDYLAPEMYQELWEELKNNNWPEIIVFANYEVHNGEAELNQTGLRQCKEMQGEEISFRYYISHLCNTMWDKLFSRQFLQEHNVWFAEGVPLGEDGIFAMECGAYQPRVCLVPKAYYYYRLFSENSTMSSASGLDREFLGIEYLQRQQFYIEAAEDDKIAMDMKICGNLHYRYNLLPKEKRVENLPYLVLFRDYLIGKYTLKELRQNRPYVRLCKLIKLKGKDPLPNVGQWIFSLRNSTDKTHKILVLFGVRIKVKRRAVHVEI